MAEPPRPSAPPSEAADPISNQRKRSSFPGTPTVAFADASGNTDLSTEKAGASRYFILTAVLTNSEAERKLRADVDIVRNRHFGKGEMKSSSVRGDDKRRLRVVADLAELDFKFVTLIVDKQKIDPESGLGYKGSFIKFLHDLLFGRLFDAHPDLKLTADEHGSPEFMASFETYVAARRPVDLFRRPSFTLARSDSEPLLQLADMISGTLLRLHESEPQATVAEPLRVLLRLRAAAFIEWPPSMRPLAAIAGASAHDAAVRAYCLNLVVEFISQHARSQDEDVAAQVATLRFLLVHFNAVSETEFVSTDRLRAALSDVGLNPPNEQAMRARVIARLRDHGVIVASSNKGYKVPASVSDVLAFVDRTDRTVYPMLQRVQRARESLLVLSSGALDVLAAERFQYLRSVLDTPLESRGGVPDEDRGAGEVVESAT